MQNLYVEISFVILIFQLFWTTLLGEEVASGLKGECMYYSTDYVLHKTKGVTVIYIWISAVYVITLL